MAHLILALSGLADDPHEALDGATPLQAAATPNLDRLAERGTLGLWHPLPELPADSPAFGVDRTLAALLGSERGGWGRAAAELVGHGASLGRRDAGVRFDLLRLQPALDVFAEPPTAEEARAIWDALCPALSRRGLEVRPVARGRALGLWEEGPVEVALAAPGELSPDEPLPAPEGERAEQVQELIDIGREVLAAHSVCRARRERDEPAWDVAWPWGFGRAPELPLHAVRWHQVTVGLTDNLAARGILRAARIPCAAASARQPARLAAEALAALNQAPSVLLHTGILDWVSHRGDPERKRDAIARIDRELLTPLLAHAEQTPLDLTVVCDYAALVASRRHASRPVPFVDVRAERLARGPGEFSEERAVEADRRIEGAEAMARRVWGRR